jgi:sugar phosphate isomerase/epimerase
LQAVAQQFSLAHLTVLGCAPPEVVRLAADTGYEYVSLRPIGLRLPGEPNFSFAEHPQLFAETKRALQDSGVRLHDIELARIDEPSDLPRYEPELARGAELGARAVISSIWTNDRDDYVEQFAALCDLARGYGLSVALEPVCIASVRTLHEAVSILQAVNRDNARLLIDTLHFHAAGEPPADLGRVPASWFGFVHLCDAPGALPADHDALVEVVRNGRLYLGEGGIDLPGILGNIPAVVYSIELPNAARVAADGYAAHARRCLATAKAYLATQPNARRRVEQS